jgi:hypothetical protein
METVVSEIAMLIFLHGFPSIVVNVRRCDVGVFLLYSDTVNLCQRSKRCRWCCLAGRDTSDTHRCMLWFGKLHSSDNSCTTDIAKY